MAKEDFKFPNDKWDESNERALSFFEKCYTYTDTLDDMMALFDISFIYYILCISIFIYFVVTSIVIFTCRKNYKFLNSNAGFTFLFSLGGLINVVNSFLIQVFIYKIFFNNHYNYNNNIIFSIISTNKQINI